MTDDNPLRVAVVTGGTTGIGLACAQRLLRSGHRVAVFSQNREKVDHARRLLVEAFGADRVIAAEVDIRNLDALERFFVKVKSTLLDIGKLFGYAWGEMRSKQY